MKPVYKEKYPHLFEPLYVGRNRVRFNNRFNVAPIGSGATGGGEDSDGRINTFGIDYWMRYIQGGFSRVTLPWKCRSTAVMNTLFNLNPKTCNQMNFQRLQRAVHAFNGRTFAEFIHGGPTCARVQENFRRRRTPPRLHSRHTGRHGRNRRAVRRICPLGADRQL